MGGYDVYCAFCGADAPRPWWDEARAEMAAASDEDYEDNYDPLLAKYVDTQWMSDTRLIGENAECTDLCKVFVTGKCVYSDCGSFVVEPGDDPRVPAPEPGDHLLNFRVYSGASVLFPFHYACYNTVFREMVQRRTASSTIDIESLYEAMKSFNPVDEFGSKLDTLDYGKISECQDQYFAIKRGTESYVMFPGADQAVIDLYNSFPELKEGGQPRAFRQEPDVTVANPFALLPMDVILEIMTYLPLDALMHFRACSQTMYNFNLSGGFWKRRFKLDGYWLYDMPENIWERNIDWAASYKMLYAGVRACKTRPLLNLANRQRIWTICEPLVDEYLVRHKRKNEEMGHFTSQMLSTAICSSMPRLIWPPPDDSATSLLPLIHDLAFDNEYNLTINVFWNNKGHLVGLGVEYLQKFGDLEPTRTVTVGDDSKFAGKDSVIIDKSSLLIGMETTGQHHRLESERRSRSLWFCVGIKLLFRDASKNVQFGQVDGAKRLLIVQEDHLLLGLRVDWSETCGISQIGLLQMRLIPGTRHHRDFYTAHERMLESESQAMRFRWSEELPAVGTQISDPSVGSWMSESTTEAEPVDALVLGITEEELSRISSFSADVRFGGFEVGCTDGSTKSIGPSRTAMRKFEIDGANGERIVGVVVVTSHVVNGLRLYTNRGRTFNLGKMANTQQREGCCLVPGAGRFMTGLYCNWDTGFQDDARLAVCGLMSLPNPRLESLDLASLVERDETGCVWDPHSPPADWVSWGVLIGQCERTQRELNYLPEMPNDSTIVAWLDCRKPVERVIAILQHPGAQKSLKLAGLTFEYTDKSRNVIGPDPERLEQDKEQRRWSPGCRCYRKGHDLTWEDRQKHYQVVEWAVGGSTLQELRVWVDGGPLTGMQLTASNGKQSSLWGTCKNKPDQTIRFIGDANDPASGAAVGLKAFVDEDGPAVTYPDFDILGFQALVPQTTITREDWSQSITQLASAAASRFPSLSPSYWRSAT